MTQEQLSVATGGVVSESLISHVETGRRNLGHDSVERLADALELAPQERAALHRARSVPPPLVSVANRLRILPGFKTGEWIGRMAATAEQQQEVNQLMGEAVDLLHEAIDSALDRVDELERRVSALEETGDEPIIELPELAEAAESGDPSGARDAPVRQRPAPDPPEA